MASSIISAEYVEDALDFAFELQENGHELSFGTETISSYRPNDDYVETGKAYVLPSEWQANFSQDVQSTDLFFYVAATIDIEACTHIIKDGNSHQILKTKRFDPDGITVIYYEIQARL